MTFGGLLLLVFLLIGVAFVVGYHYLNSNDEKPKANYTDFKIAEDGTIIRIGAEKKCWQCKRTFPDSVKRCPECWRKLK